MRLTGTVGESGCAMGDTPTVPIGRRLGAEAVHSSIIHNTGLSWSIGMSASCFRVTPAAYGSDHEATQDLGICHKEMAC